MRRMFFFFVVLLTAVVGIGMGAMAQSAKPAAKAPATLAESHVAKGLKCNSCHDTKKPQAVSTAKCQTCHEGKALAKRTAATKPANPHDTRHFGTEADCNLCHHAHVQSENTCAQCHHTFKWKVP